MQLPQRQPLPSSHLQLPQQQHQQQQQQQQQQQRQQQQQQQQQQQLRNTRVAAPTGITFEQAYTALANAPPETTLTMSIRSVNDPAYRWLQSVPTLGMLASRTISNTTSNQPRPQPQTESQHQPPRSGDKRRFDSLSDTPPVAWHPIACNRCGVTWTFIHDVAETHPDSYECRRDAHNKGCPLTAPLGSAASRVNYSSHANTVIQTSPAIVVERNSNSDANTPKPKRRRRHDAPMRALLASIKINDDGGCLQSLLSNHHKHEGCLQTMSSPHHVYHLRVRRGFHSIYSFSEMIHPVEPTLMILDRDVDSGALIQREIPAGYCSCPENK